MIKNNEELKDFIVKCLDDKKAEDITVIDLGTKTSIANYMIFASGRSTRNIKAMAEYISFELKHNSNLTVSIEGLELAEWVLIDIGNIIVHLFYPEARKRFNLEEMWKSKSTAIHKPSK